MENHPPSADAHKNHADHRFHYLMLGTALLAGGVILSPYVLPALGYGTQERAFEIMSNLQHATISSGLAGTINSGLGALPLIGSTLAAGGIWPAAIAGAVGIGGVLLGRYLEKKHNGKPGINWGKVIKYAALSTSLLIALPSILSSITVGITYMSYAFGDLELAEAAGTFLAKTIGVVGTASHTVTGLTGALAALPHFLTCGLPLVPAALSLFMEDDKKPESSEHKYSDGSVTIEMLPGGKLEQGKPVHAKLILRHRDGRPVSADELAVVHTEKLHLFVADSSLKDYHHIHPQPTGEPGVLAFTFTPQTANNYSAWADFTMIKDGQNHKLRTEMPSASGRNIPPSIRANTSAEKNGLHFDWQSDPLQKDTASIVNVNVTDARGEPVTDLEPVMGAYAHLVGFSADGKSIIHTHPLDAEPQNASDRGGPRLRFHVEPDCSGATQFYLQVRRGNEDIYVPFGQQIKPPALATERTVISSHAEMGHAK